MSEQTSSPFLHLLLMLLCAAVVGGFAGAFTADLRVSQLPEPTASATTTVIVQAPTSTASVLPMLVKAQSRASDLAVVPDGLLRRASPVGAVYRRPKTGAEDRTLGDDKLLAQVTAVTSDGWFVTVASALGQTRLADMVVWYGGTAYPVTQGVTDRVNGTAYLKITRFEIGTPALSDVSDLRTGTGVWMERDTAAFLPTVVTSLAVSPRVDEPASSEVAMRRFTVWGGSDRIGAPVWGESGVLIGLVEAASDHETRVIPASSIGSSLTSLLRQQGTVHHAVLGVRSVDLALWRMDADRKNLPDHGALLRDGGKGITAVVKDSPAAKAKLRAGDVIFSVERDILDGSRDLGEILSMYQPGTPVTLRVFRDGAEVTVPVTLGDAVTSEAMK